MEKRELFYLACTLIVDRVRVVLSECLSTSEFLESLKIQTLPKTCGPANLRRVSWCLQALFPLWVRVRCCRVLFHLDLRQWDLGSPMKPWILVRTPKNSKAQHVCHSSQRCKGYVTAARNGHQARGSGVRTFLRMVPGGLAHGSLTFSKQTFLIVGKVDIDWAPNPKLINCILGFVI